MSHYGVTSDLSLGRPSSTMGRPIFSQRPLSQLASPNPFYSCSPHLELYVKALEDERQKIDAFKRELPICMQLLDDAIEASKEQLTKGFGLPLGSTNLHMSCSANGKSSLSNEKRGTDELVIWKKNWENRAEGDEDVDKEESRPWSKSFEREASQEQCLWKHDIFHSRQNEPSPTRCIKLELEQNSKVFENKLLAKTNEMEEGTATMKRESRLAASSPYGALCINGSPRREEIKELLSKEGLFSALDPDPKGMLTADILDFRKKEVVPPASVAAPGRSNSSSQQPRKARRCWSPELHQRFLHALHQLGGPQVATPKQIRELMNVEGLTNDEVKSHLQKFRLHTRRPPFGGAAANTAEQAQHGPHLVVFGGIWVPPDYGGTHAAASPPVAASARQSGGSIYGGHSQRYAQFSPSLLNHTTTEYNCFQSQHERTNLVCQNLMQDQQPIQIQFSESGPQDRMEAASEVDVARSESSSLNGEAGRVDDQEEEEPEIQFGFRRTD